MTTRTQKTFQGPNGWRSGLETYSEKEEGTRHSGSEKSFFQFEYIINNGIELLFLEIEFNDLQVVIRFGNSLRNC